MAYEDEQRIMRTGKALRKEETHLTPSRADVFVLAEKMPLRDKNGEIIGTFGISRDITERKRAEMALAQEQYLLDTLMRTTPDHIYFKDKESKFLRISDSLAKQFGCDDVSATIGKTDFDFFAEEHARQAYEDEQAIMRTGEILIREEKEIWKNAPESWVYSIKQPFRDKDGTIIGTFGISRDITERKKDEDRIRSLLNEKEMILKEVHHRIKNNMGIIKSLLSLQARAMAEPNAAKALDDASGRIDSMMLLYEKLYGSSEFATVSARDYLSSLVDRIVENSPDTWTLAVTKDIDDFDLDVRRMQSLGIIVNELITNALKYAFVDRPGGAIALAGAMRENHIVITVKDDGRGIPEAVDFAKSSGFGLMLVKALTDQLKGDIRLERGNGTKIVLEFDRL